MTSRIPDRRVPGTLALAVTNGTGAVLLAVPAGFHSESIHRYAVSLLPVTMWGLLFALSAAALTAAVVSRRWVLLNVGAGLSIFVWTFLCVAAFATSIRDGPELSPVAYALFVWVLTGQAAMLFAPLVAGRDEQSVS